MKITKENLDLTLGCLLAPGAANIHEALYLRGQIFAVRLLLGGDDMPKNLKASVDRAEAKANTLVKGFCNA